MSEPSHPAVPAGMAAPARTQVHEVCGVFLDRDHLVQAMPHLTGAGFRLADISAVLERHGERPMPVTTLDLNTNDFTPADERSTRTLGTSLAGAMAALAAAGVTVLTGGAALAAVGAAALVGGTAAAGVHALSTKAGLDGVPNASSEAPEDVIVSVRADAPGEVERATEALRAAGAARLEPSPALLKPPGVCAANRRAGFVGSFDWTPAQPLPTWGRASCLKRPVSHRGTGWRGARPR